MLNFCYQQVKDILSLLGISYVSILKDRIHEYLNINSFKDDKESDKMGADSAHIQGACRGRINGFTSSEWLSFPDYWHAEYVSMLLKYYH